MHLIRSKLCTIPVDLRDVVYNNYQRMSVQSYIIDYRGSGYLVVMVYALLIHTATELVLASLTYSKYVGLAIARIVLVLLAAELL